MFGSDFASNTLAMALQVWTAFGFGTFTGFMVAALLSIFVVVVLIGVFTRHH